MDVVGVSSQYVEIGVGESAVFMLKLGLKKFPMFVSVHPAEVGWLIGPAFLFRISYYSLTYGITIIGCGVNK